MNNKQQPNTEQTSNFKLRVAFPLRSVEHDVVFTSAENYKSLSEAKGIAKSIASEKNARCEVLELNETGGGSVFFYDFTNKEKPISGHGSESEEEPGAHKPPA